MEDTEDGHPPRKSLVKGERFVRSEGKPWMGRGGRGGRVEFMGVEIKSVILWYYGALGFGQFKGVED